MTLKQLSVGDRAKVLGFTEGGKAYRRILREAVDTAIVLAQEGSTLGRQMSIQVGHKNSA